MQGGLGDQEQATVDLLLSIINIVIVLLIVLLLVFALAVRYIAKRSTRPCPWCMEFISKKEVACPRCGKTLAMDN